jgi:hypothetical protein
MTEENISLGRKEITDDLSKLLDILPAATVRPLASIRNKAT